MKIHLHKEIDKLKKNILILGSMFEESLNIAVSAVIDKGINEAEKIIENDTYIDRKEIEIEEECLKILALHQPVATDLRYVAACLKVNNELERIGDLVANIARRVIAITNDTENELCVDFKPMMDITRQMLKDALDSLIYMNSELALEVLEHDDIVDECNSRMFNDLQDHIRVNPENTEFYINLLSVSRHLERIADCTTNIAEDVIYMIKGQIIRHGRLNEKYTMTL